MRIALLLLVFLLNLLAADFYVSDPETYSFADVEIKASYYPDKAVSAELNSVYLEVKNPTPYNLRFEPNFNSQLVDAQGRRYYRQRVISSAEFVSGTIPPKSERKGFIYFKKFKSPVNERFSLIVKSIKLYDGKSPLQQAEWKFMKVSENAETEILKINIDNAILENTEEVIKQAKNLDNLEYDKQLIVAKAGRENYDQLKFKVDMPAALHRGEELNLKFYAPTIADVESVTALIGTSQYLDLRKEPEGVFSGYLKIPEFLDYGKYVVSFYIRFPDGNKTIRQKTLEIKSY